MADLLAAVLAAGDASPDRPALTGAGVTLTHRQLAERILRTAGGLHRRGLEPGDRMLFSVRPGPAGIVLALGTVAAGGSVVFIDPGVGPELFAARAELAGARWAAAESILYAAGLGPVRAVSRRRGLLLPDYRRLPLRPLHAGPWLPGVPAGSIPVAALADGGTPMAPATDPHAPAVIIFTSGSTADPKAVVHSRASLGSALDLLAAGFPLGPGDRVFTDQLHLGLATLAAGAHWRLPPFGFRPRVDPRRFAELLGDATHAFLVPADLSVVLHAILRGEAPRPGALQQLLVGGAPVLPPLLRLAARVLPRVRLTAVYGATEILPIAMIDGARKLAGHGDGDPVGELLPGLSGRITADGQLAVTGPNLCAGYLGSGPPAEHLTGDLARLDEREVVLLGRAGDMLIRGLTNIYPGLYEPAIAALPGVAQAAIVGVPDEIGDDVVVLVLVPADPTDTGLISRVRHALPGIVDSAAQPDHVVLVPEMPTAGRSRKPDRAALRHTVRQLLPANNTGRHELPDGRRRRRRRR